MNDTIQWLLDGDVSIQYMTHKRLLDSAQQILEPLQARLPTEGFVAELLSCRCENGHWGLYFYQPKWTSTHYTLLELKNLCAPATLEPCREMVVRMFDACQHADGSLNLSKYEHPSDICVDGMALQYAAYFCPENPGVLKLARYLLTVQKADGGFSWDARSQTGDPHTTICVLEGLGQLSDSMPEHGIGGVRGADEMATAFLLSHGLYMDDVDIRFRKLSYPYRYRYDLLRALEYMARRQVFQAPCMQPAIEWLQSKRKKDGRWVLENRHKGNVHVEMEEVGKPSRFITLKALTILKAFGLRNVTVPGTVTRRKQ